SGSRSRAARTAAGATRAWRRRSRTTPTARTTTWRSSARAPPTTSGRPRARPNDAQADAGRQRAAFTAGASAPRAPGGPAARAGPHRAARLHGHRDPARRAADAGEPVRRGARGGRGLGAQALGAGPPLLQPQGRRGGARLRAVLARGRAAQVHAGRRDGGPLPW